METEYNTRVKCNHEEEHNICSIQTNNKNCNTTIFLLYIFYLNESSFQILIESFFDSNTNETKTNKKRMFHLNLTQVQPLFNYGTYEWMHSLANNRVL